MNKDYLKKFYTFKVEDFVEFHNKAFPHAHDRTKKSFKQALQRIEKVYEKPMNQLFLKFLDDPKETMNKLKESKYSHQTNVSTFCSILKLLKLMGFPLDEYNKFQTICNLEAKKNQLGREDELKEKLGFLPNFQDLKQLLREKIDSINETSTFNDVKLLLILSIMVLSVPLKLIQYSKMGIAFVNIKETKTKYVNNYLLEDIDGNYFIKSGDISIKVNDKHLIKLISLWINEFNPTKHFFIQTESSKTGMNNKEIRTALEIASNQYIGDNLSNSEIRALYMKNLMDLDPSFKEKIQLSALLGYKNTNILELHKV